MASSEKSLGRPHVIFEELSAGSISGFIRAWNEEFSFGKPTPDSGQPNGEQLEIRNETLISASRRPSNVCDGAPAQPTIDRPQSRSTAFTSTAETSSGTGILVAQIAIDSTVEWFDRFGSVATAQSQILNVMAQVSTLYEDQVQIQLQVPYLRVFESEPDPYDGAGMDVGQLLSEMFNEWNESTLR